MNQDPHREPRSAFRQDADGSLRRDDTFAWARRLGGGYPVAGATNFIPADLRILAPQAAGNTWYPNSFLAPIAIRMNLGSPRRCTKWNRLCGWQTTRASPRIGSSWRAFRKGLVSQPNLWRAIRDGTQD